MRGAQDKLFSAQPRWVLPWENGIQDSSIKRSPEYVRGRRKPCTTRQLAFLIQISLQLTAEDLSRVPAVRKLRGEAPLCCLGRWSWVPGLILPKALQPLRTHSSLLQCLHTLMSR